MKTEKRRITFDHYAFLALGAVFATMVCCITFAIMEKHRSLKEARIADKDSQPIWDPVGEVVGTLPVILVDGRHFEWRRIFLTGDAALAFTNFVAGAFARICVEPTRAGLHLYIPPWVSMRQPEPAEIKTRTLFYFWREDGTNVGSAVWMVEPEGETK